MNTFIFRTIDISKDSDVCVSFRRDSYKLSFGSLDGVEGEMGALGRDYLTRLAAKIALVPQGNAHLWSAGEIIGQTEMKTVDEPDVGYVNLFYLVPSFRGLGMGELLHQHACNVFSALGKRRLQLSVSPTNERALRFYTKLGWRLLGPRPGREKMLLMEFRL